MNTEINFLPLDFTESVGTISHPHEPF